MDLQHLQPGVPQQLDQHVTRIVAPNGGPMTGPGTNTYLVGGARELLVIDPGADDESHMQAIVKASTGRASRWIMCTHAHVDHAPGAARLKELTGTPIAAMTAPVTDHDVGLDLDKVLRADEVIGCGGVSLRAVHTPGHASNHVCFLL